MSGISDCKNKNFSKSIQFSHDVSRAIAENDKSNSKVAYENFYRPAYYGTMAQVNRKDENGKTL